MTQDKFVQAGRKREAYRGMLADGAMCRWHMFNGDCADLDKSDARVIDGQFFTIYCNQ